MSILLKIKPTFPILYVM